MIQSGIAPLDLQLGGFSPGRLHLLTGGPGTGKTTASLQFLQAGLRNGESGALITLDRTDDLALHARSIGMDLEAAVRANRLVIVRFRAPFSSLLESAGSPAPMIAELSAMIAEVRPARVVVDPLTPFLSERSVTGAAIAAFVVAMEELALTTIVTYPNDVSAGFDARLGSAIQRAAVILHLTHTDNGARGLRVVQTRTQPAPSDPLRLQWKQGVGLIALDEHPQPQLEVLPPKRARRSPKREVST